MSFAPTTLYLTHYSSLTPSSRIIAGLHEQIDDYIMLTENAADTGDQFEATLAEELNEYLVCRCTNELNNVDENTARHWLKLDANLNAQGLAFWWQHRRTN